MDNYQDVFERYEKKYLLNKEQDAKLRCKLKDAMTTDEYGKTTICNIYFDTPDYQLIRNSLEKPVYKEKLRLRSYGVPEKNSAVFIELKKKYKGIVYKRRVGMDLNAAQYYLYYKQSAKKQSQIIKEIDWFLSYYKEIKPQMYISYERTAMYGNENHDLRLTLDTNILWRMDALNLELGSFGDPLLKKGERLLEIKIPEAMPMWLSAILDELKIYPVSFSKYGRAYQEFSLNGAEKKGGKICA